MGRSPYATVAWGYDLGGSDGDWKCDQDKFEKLRCGDVLKTILGFTKTPPWHDGVKCSQEDRDQYFARELAAVPVETTTYGDIDYAGYLLVLRRKSYAYWGVEEFDAASAIYPTLHEYDCFQRILDYLNYTGSRTPKLLIWASYS